MRHLHPVINTAGVRFFNIKTNKNQLYVSTLNLQLPFLHYDCENVFVKLREWEGQRVDLGRSLKGHL